MIVLEGVAARQTPLTLSNLNASWGPGIHAILGAPSDGGSLLLHLLAGWTRPRSGYVRVLAGNPTLARVRSQIARVPLHPALPDALRVGEIMALARRLRGDPQGRADDGLSLLGLEALAPRMGRSLTPDEGRAVLLAEALGSSRVRVLLIEEPGVRVEARASHRLGAALREFTRDGRVVLMVTSSARDAEVFADDTWTLRAGCLQGPWPPMISTRGALRGPPRAPPSTSGALRGPPRAPPSLPLDGLTRGASLRVHAKDSRALTAALTGDPEIAAVSYEDGGLRVWGPNALALAEAVGRAIVSTQAVVHELRMEAGDDTAPAAIPADSTMQAGRSRLEVR